MTRGFVERMWYGSDLAASTARTLLRPAGWAYAAVTGVRNVLYDRGLLAVQQPAVPALSLGNLSVGGTGKTPVAAWAARELVARGGHPAIVLRGYGADEPLVHERLNPDVPVIADPDRVRGAAEAARRGADCVVLDDAFQHRRIARVEEWVLVSAEQWRDGAQRLPAGPMRESERALRRASLVIVTRKSASLVEARLLAERLGRRVPTGATAVMHLVPHALVAADGSATPVAHVAGRRYLAVAAIGAPDAFFAQLRAQGAEIVEAAYRDHHRFSAADVSHLTALARGSEGVLCTLKDAVKLAPLWRGADAPLWYVSQAAVVDSGRLRLDESLEAVLTARTHAFRHAGSAGQSLRGHGHRSPTADR